MSGPVLSRGRTLTLCQFSVFEIENVPRRSSITKHAFESDVSAELESVGKKTVSSPNSLTVAESIASGALQTSRAVCSVANLS